MTAGRFARVREIVLGAAELPRAQQAAYLDHTCGDDPLLRAEVESLLAHQDAELSILRASHIERLAADRLGAAAPEPPAAHPERIGPYRVLAVLGEGGMGVVYHAEQIEPIRREVAVKLVRGGLPAQQVAARFAAERQVQALMEHPHIAKVLDAGADEHGRPFLVMELVRGVPITAYCAQHALSVPGRLRLLAAVCRAVHHAHQKGIIHRDLKPSNILVGERDGQPDPRVIDFGIAKALEDSAADAPQLTVEGQLVGTISYMSPEQLRGLSREIDTRSDVYALGAVMYELLTGQLPHGEPAGSLVARIRAICEEPPAPLAATVVHGKRLGAELQAIVFKALAKAPDDRYPSVAALADDIERLLAAQPILARPPSAAYQLRKLIARNPTPAALVVGIALLIVGFAIGMSVLYARSETNLRRALQAESQATQVSGFLTGLFEISDPSEARGNAITAREILDSGAQRIESELSEQPIVRSRLMRTMGTVYRGLGIHDRARELLESATAAAAAAPGAAASGEERADALNDLARVDELQGRLGDAAAHYRQALAIKERLFGPRDPKVAATLTNLALVAKRQAHPDTAVALLTRARDIFEAASPRSLELTAALNNLAQIHTEAGRLDEARTLFARSLAIREEILPPDHPELATALNNLADLDRRAGRYAQAEPLARRALAIWDKVLGPAHPDFAAALMNLAALYKDWGRNEQALPLLTHALTIQEQTLGPTHPDVAIALNNLGRLYQQLDRLDDADAALTRSLRIKRGNLGPDHPEVSTSLNSLGELRVAQNRLAEADTLYRHALAIRTAAYGRSDARTALVMHNLGRLMHTRGRPAEAESLLTAALAVREATLGPDHPRVAESLEACAALYRETGRAALADSCARRVAVVRERAR